MSDEALAVKLINEAIAQLPDAAREACHNLASSMRADVFNADSLSDGQPVGTLAIALVGAELQLANSKR